MASASGSSGAGASASGSAGASAASLLPGVTPVPLDFSKASNPLWLVKIPKYLAKKWSEASDNSQVGKIIITQTKNPSSNAPKPKPQIVFQLNEALGQNVQVKISENKFLEHKIPLEHKFLMTPIANQNVYILKQSTEDSAKDSLSIMGKVIQRAECTPVQNDSSYMDLKRETNKQFNEPKNFIKIVDDRKQRTKFIPKIIQQSNRDKTQQQKRLRNDRGTVQDALFAAFTKHQYYTLKDLEKITRQPQTYLKDILHEICRHITKGPHKNTWELKDEYKQTNSASESKKPAEAAGGATAMDDDDDEDDDDDFEDLDDDDDAMIGQM